MTPAEELEQRERELAAREAKVGYSSNCEALRRRIAELKEVVNG